MRLVEEADVAGAVCSFGGIKKKKKQREKIAFHLSFLKYSLSRC